MGTLFPALPSVYSMPTVPQKPVQKPLYLPEIQACVAAVEYDGSSGVAFQASGKSAAHCLILHERRFYLSTIYKIDLNLGGLVLEWHGWFSLQSVELSN